MTLRPYRIGDQEAVLAIWWDSWHSIRPGLRHPHPLADWRARWTGEIVPAQAIAVADDGTVVGFAAANVAARELTQIFIAPRHQRRGIERQLLTWAQEQMPAGFSLHTLVDNLGSRAFYHRHGLAEGGRCTNPVNGMPTIEYRWMPAGSREDR